MLIEHDGARPMVAGSAYVSPTAVLCGDVQVGPGSRLLFGAVLTAEDGPVVIGADCIVMENAVVRGRSGYPALIGDRVLIGPHAHVNGANVDDEVFIATGASAFPGSRLGRGSEVRIGGVVHINTTLPEDAVVPIGWIAVGDPASLLPPDQHDAIWELQSQLDFLGTVASIDRGALVPGHSPMVALIGRYKILYGRHCNDTILCR